MEKMKLFYNIYNAGDRIIYHCHIMDENNIYTGQGAFLSLEELQQVVNDYNFLEVKRIYI